MKAILKKYNQNLKNVVHLQKQKEQKEQKEHHQKEKYNHQKLNQVNT